MPSPDSLFSKLSFIGLLAIACAASGQESPEVPLNLFTIDESHLVCIIPPQISQTPLLDLPTRLFDILPCNSEENITSCGLFQVPLDWHDPAAGTGQIQFYRLPANDPATRKGTIFIHHGVYIVCYVPALYSSSSLLGVGRYNSALGPDGALLIPGMKNIHQRVGEQYDVVVWNPRGTRGDTMYVSLRSPSRVVD